MSNPVTGPTTVVRPSVLRDAPGSFYDYRKRYKQKKPYHLALPYIHYGMTTTSATKSDNLATYLNYAKAGLARSNWQVGCPPNPFEVECKSEFNLAKSTAREAFRDTLSEQAMWLVNLAERKQAIEMMTRRAGQLYRFAMLLRRGNVHLAWKQLHSAAYTPKNYNRIKSKSFADSFLEFHFGWEPLVKDIGTSVDILQQPIPLGEVHGLGKKILVNSKFDLTTNGPFAKEVIHGEITGHVRAKCGATVRVTNPNLWLANNYGFTNPATVAWELVPFSFVLDWFTTVGSFLQQWSDLHGLALEQAWVTTRGKLTSSSTYDLTPKPSGEVQWVRATQTGSYTRRELGIPEVNLAIRQVHRLSVVRAATAISLLIQKGLK